MKKNGYLFIVVVLAAIALIGFQPSPSGAADCTLICQNCHTATAPTGYEVAATFHPANAGAPVMCIECHQQNYATCNSPVPEDGVAHSGTDWTGNIVPIACTGCHTLTSPCAPYITDDGLESYASVMHVGAGTDCAACHTDKSMSSLAHPTVSVVASCASCHTTQHQSALNVDVACGECHGGSQGASATKNGAMYFDEAVLVVYAAGMHDASKLPPTVAHTTLVSPVLKGSAVTFVDASKDNNSESIASIYVNWGDGQTQTGAAGATFSHTYANTGKYNVVHTVTDAGGRMASELIPVQVMAGSTTRTRITVTVTQSNGTTPISGARIYLKKAGVLKTTGYSNTSGVWTFSNLLPAADYTVEVYKSGVNFGKGTGKMSTAATVDASADAVLTVTAVTP